jgi:hypothetical protein
MVTKTKVAPKHNKSQFAHEVLTKNPQANATAVNDAWMKGGRDGQISATLVNKLRATMGLTGNLRAKRKKTGSTPAANLHSAPKLLLRTAKSESTGRVGVGRSASNGRGHEHASISAGPLNHREVPSHALDELEADIDRLIFRVMALGGSPAIEDALRQARRLLFGTFAKKLV